MATPGFMLDIGPLCKVSETFETLEDAAAEVERRYPTTRGGGAVAVDVPKLRS